MNVLKQYCAQKKVESSPQISLICIGCSIHAEEGYFIQGLYLL